MTVPRQRIERSVFSIRQRIAAAAERVGRRAGEVCLVAVTKTVGPEEIAVLRELGIMDFGENRVEQIRPKLEQIGTSVCWHMIGSIQRRKARDVAAFFDTVDSVDRVELAEVLQRRCEELDKRLRVLLEVNVSGETQKHGFNPESLGSVLGVLKGFDRLMVEGLMTMAPLDAPEVVLRSVFRGLRQLAEAHGLRELSMGMTDDFEIAIEEGATQVRIGRALFE
ncbi:MAG TPA: YggS family pyridoxal phosphate-dependent enzyme [Candidatus Hydrogenedentes bacterium]|nr:YggS family pyridoxal phosphate-dependent enzyme [Candidatus Hydrogenedentota bacterium]